LWCTDETRSAQWTICVPSLHLLILRREDARKGRWAGGDQVHPQALLLPGRHRASVGGTGPVPLRILLSMPLLDMMRRIVSCETPEAAATRRSGSFCSTTRCSTVSHSEAGRPYAGRFGPRRRDLITAGGGLPSVVSSSASRC
jgi:hypothetical protein